MIEGLCVVSMRKGSSSNSYDDIDRTRSMLRVCQVKYGVRIHCMSFFGTLRRAPR